MAPSIPTSIIGRFTLKAANRSAPRMCRAENFEAKLKSGMAFFIKTGSPNVIDDLFY